MANNETASEVTARSKVEAYATLMPMLQAMFREFQDASKKKPEAALNTKKIDIVNRLITGALSLLEGQPERKYLDLLESDEMPQNSDVVLILGQVVAAMEAFKKRYYKYSQFEGWRWMTEDGPISDRD